MGSARGAKRAVPCDDPLAKFRVVEIGTPGYVCSTGQLRQEMRPNGVLCVEPLEPKYVAFTPPVEPVALETCTEIEYSDGPYTDCFPGERWEYIGCWAGGRIVLEQKKKGTWVTVKQNISTKDGCSDGFPWTVEFTRKASGVGVKQYRLYFPGTDDFQVGIENIKVTVKEK